jgi:hypothetical protein
MLVWDDRNNLTKSWDTIFKGTFSNAQMMSATQMMSAMSASSAMITEAAPQLPHPPTA